MKINNWIILFLLLTGQVVRAQVSGTVPAELRSSLGQFREQDDLSGWIYAQLQWVAKSPASRSGRLVLATKEAWRHPRSNEEARAWLDLLTNEGYALLLNGSIVSSTDAYTAAYDWARQHRDITDESQVLETILKPLGNNYTRLGDYEQALFIHRKALALALAGQDKQVLAGVYSNLANTSSNMGQSHASLEYCRLGLEVVNDHSALCGLILSEQADAALQLQETGLARQSIGKSISILEKAFVRREDPASGYWLLMAYQQAGDIYTANSDEALSYYKKALVVQTRLEGGIRRRERAKLFLRLGSLLTRKGDIGQALPWLDECLGILVPGKNFETLYKSDLYAENTLVDLLYIRAGVAQQLKDTAEALRIYELCFAAEDRLRHELISSSSREHSVSDTRNRYESAIGYAWAVWERTQDKKYLSDLLGFMEGSKAQLLLEELQQQQRYRFSAGDSVNVRIRLLEKALLYYEKEGLEKRDSSIVDQQKQIGWELARLRKTVPAGAGEGARTGGAGEGVGTTMMAGVAVRSFFCGSAAIYTVESSASGISFAERLPLSVSWQDSLRTFIATWFEKGANAMIDHPQTYYRQAYAVYRDLFGQHPFQTGASYILLPDGALNLLPVEALVTSSDGGSSPADWPFVVKQAQVSYGWSLRTLREQGEPSRAQEFSGFFLSGTLRSTPFLNAIAAERSGLERVIPTGSWYTNEQATTAAFRKALVSSAVLHISSHAFTKKDSLDLPHIELFDAPFYLFELKGLESQPELVVLSACRTGDGRIVTGEGAQSLARAFIGGGAKAVIAGWWNVNDETAARVMQEFYSRLVAEQDNTAIKGNAARALRAAKLSWLKDPAVPYLKKLPYFWAALNYQGNPQPLKEAFIPGTGDRRAIPWWGWVVLSSVIILVLYRVRRLYTKA